MYDPSMYGFAQGAQPPPTAGPSAPGALPIAASPMTPAASAISGIDPEMIQKLMKYASAMRNPQSTTQAPKIGMPSDTSPPGSMVA